MTARQAVQELVHEGRLYTVIGKGTFVSPITKIEPPMNTIWGFSDSFSSIERASLVPLIIDQN
jgi:DNA-binding GntR family transcriptional regulator